MKLNMKMPVDLLPNYTKELVAYKNAWLAKDIVSAWHHLERAHIIGQRYPMEHTETHWKMLILGFRTRNLNEIFGQMLRLVLGAPFSFINKIPVGNVGSTRVSIIKAQEIPEDIAEMLSESQV